jgi:hypothetical protein
MNRKTTPMRLLSVLAGIFLLTACNSDNGSKSATGAIEIDGLPLAFDLMDADIIKKHLPVGDAELRSHEAVGDLKNENSDGRYWMWMPEENIRDSVVDGYIQTNAHGVVYVGIEHNPEYGDGEWAVMKMSQLEKQTGGQAPPGVNTIRISYEPMEGVGEQAYYSNRVSHVKFRVNNTHVVTVQVEYPYPAEQRKEIVKQMALDVIGKMRNLPTD